jgi:hypothetical protein
MLDVLRQLACLPPEALSDIDVPKPPRRVVA